MTSRTPQQQQSGSVTPAQSAALSAAASHHRHQQFQLVNQNQFALPLDDIVLLKLLLRSIMYDVPWGKPEEERLADGTYSALEKLEVAKRMVPCIDDDTFDAAITVVREEDPVVSLKVLFNEADSFKNLQMAPPDPFYEGTNWKNSELRQKRVREFYETARKRARFSFRDESQRKEESWKYWNMVQTGEAMRRPPERADLIMPGENFIYDAEEDLRKEKSKFNKNTNDNNNDHSPFGGAASDGNNNNHNLDPLSQTQDDSVNMARIPKSSLVEPDGQFIGGQQSSCFGGVLGIRVHALRYHGKSDSKVVSALPQRLNGSFVFCINTRPQSMENDLSTMASRSFMTPHSVTDYDLELEDDIALPEFHLGEENEQKRREKEAEKKEHHRRTSSLQSKGINASYKSNNNNNNNNNNNDDNDEDLPEIDEVIPIKDVRPADYHNKVNGNNKNMVSSNNKNKYSANNNNSNNDDDQQQGQQDGKDGGGNKKKTTETSFFWDFRDEYVTLDLGCSPIRVDFSELVLNFRTPPTCCGIFGVNEICTVRIPMSALYVHVLALNSINRRRHFGSGEEGVHSVHKWFECTPSDKLASATEDKGSFSICLSMHLHCRSRAHNKPLYPNWNPFTDNQFDVHKGTCKILTNVPAMQQIWKEPLHRYFITLIENFNSRLEDIEVSIIENFHDLYVLDPQLLFVWTLRSQLFSGKLFSVDDRQTIRRAATHLSSLIASGDQLYTYTSEKLVNDTKKHTINRFLALPGSLEELFGEDDRLIHANDALYLAVLVLQTFQFNDLESSISEAAKRDVAAFFVVACDTVAEIQTRFGVHCQEVLKDFSLCFQHMKKAIDFGIRVKKLEDKMLKRSALAQNQQNLAGTRLTASRVIFLRMQVMGQECTRRLRTAINYIHIAGANSTTKDRPEAISPLMQLMAAATDCADTLAQFDLEKVGHELEGIVPQTFLPMFLSLARERLHSLIDNIVRKFEMEPAKAGRVYSTPAASDAFQFIRATFDEFCECAKSCDVETVLICLGSLMNYMIEAVDVFITAIKDWASELEDSSNPINTVLQKADLTAGACLARFDRERINFERTLTLHATLSSFYRLLVDFWEDDATVDFIENLEAAISHVGDDDAGSDSEHQVFQAKASMMEACNSAIFQIEVSMLDRVFSSALALPLEYVAWSKHNPVKSEEELQDQQRDIAGATVHCIKQVFLAIMHRADRETLRDRLCHVSVRGIVSNLINELVLNGNMMSTPEDHDYNLRLQRGLSTAIVQVSRAELVTLCDCAGETVLETTKTMLFELDTALAIGLMSSYQLVGTLGDLQTQIAAEKEENAKIASDGGNGPGHRHKRSISGGLSMLKISKEKYERLLRKACVARAKVDDKVSIEYCINNNVKEYVTDSSHDQNNNKSKKKK